MLPFGPPRSAKRKTDPHLPDDAKQGMWWRSQSREHSLGWIEPLPLTTLVNWEGEACRRSQGWKYARGGFQLLATPVVAEVDMEVTAAAAIVLAEGLTERSTAEHQQMHENQAEAAAGSARGRSIGVIEEAREGFGVLMAQEGRAPKSTVVARGDTEVGAHTMALIKRSPRLMGGGTTEAADGPDVDKAASPRRSADDVTKLSSIPAIGGGPAVARTFRPMTSGNSPSLPAVKLPLYEGKANKTSSVAGAVGLQGSAGRSLGVKGPNRTPPLTPPPQFARSPVLSITDISRPLSAPSGSSAGGSAPTTTALLPRSRSVAGPVVKVPPSPSRLHGALPCGTCVVGDAQMALTRSWAHIAIADSEVPNIAAETTLAGVTAARVVKSEAVKESLASGQAARRSHHEERRVKPRVRHDAGAVVAVRTANGRLLAMKVVQTDGDVQKEKEARQEAELLEVCAPHPNVVDMLGVIKTNTTYYTLMSLADGDVAAMMKHAGRLTEKQAVFLIRQLVSALEFLHARRIVHCDVKPANMLLVGSINKMRLADFGLSAKVPRGHAGVNGACRTLPYMSPELFNGAKFGTAVDMWATGVVAYELMMGVLPFAGGGKSSTAPRGSGGSVSTDSSGSIVTDCGSGPGTSFRNSSSSSRGASPRPASILATGDRDGLLREKRARKEAKVTWRERVRADIINGEYTVDDGAVGHQGRRFIEKLLQKNPSDRMSAYVAAGHSWLDPNSTIPARRRAVRLTVAEAQVDLMVRLVKRLKSRAGGLVDPAHPAAMKSAEAVEATAAAVSVLSESALLAVAAAAELRAECKAARALDKAASAAVVSAKNTKEARQEQVGANASPAKSGGGDYGGHGVFGLEAMFHEAEEAVRRAEVCARRMTLAGEAAVCAVTKWRDVVKPQ
ncbi:conserved unknown protein [Ectocarpus siliculosus]|uniref:Protein kinase domain-containing protein n=1 Tax=Ectocarpus siliculosus TaxID=2880 RepID=D8LT15_ECTSI|nr:conserved unknown protein [Ectocarpus siliculosus]|eukprot:CBN75345.1 conserved unknown protein [Ectocarpus siliculosus]